VPHLIQTLIGDEELDQLENAYVVLAEAYLEHRAGRANADEDQSSFETLRTRVLASEDRVPVGKMCRAKCPLITAEEERPIELFNNLGQIEVLIAAIKIMRDLKRPPTQSAPTQQSKDDDGNDLSDLEGLGWKLEAFGGQNCTSNQKLFEDLCTLKSSAVDGDDLFLAFRRTAWSEAYKTKQLEIGTRTQVSGTTKKIRSDFEKRKVSVQAYLELVGELDGICVSRVTELICTPNDAVVQG